MRKHGKIDSNQKAIVEALRKAGCSVQSLASIGNGCPDLLVGRNGRNYLLEVKDGAKSPSQRQLTADEEDWLARWRGTAHTHVVLNIDEALRAVGAIT